MVEKTSFHICHNGKVSRQNGIFGVLLNALSDENVMDIYHTETLFCLLSEFFHVFGDS